MFSRMHLKTWVRGYPQNTYSSAKHSRVACFHKQNVLTQQFTQDLKPSGHWLCLRIQDLGCNKPPYTCYILRCPPAPFLLLAGVKRNHLELVLESITLALDCRGYADLDLSGRNLDSLMDSLVHQHCQVSSEVCVCVCVCV